MLLFCFFCQIGRPHYPHSKRDLISQPELVVQLVTWRPAVVADTQKSASTKHHDTHDDLSYTRIRVTTDWPSRTTPTNSPRASGKWERTVEWYRTRMFRYSQQPHNTNNALIRWATDRRVASQTLHRLSPKRVRTSTVRLKSTTRTLQVSSIIVELIAMQRTTTYRKAGKKWKKAARRITGIYGLELFNTKDQLLWWYVLVVNLRPERGWVGGWENILSWFEFFYLTLKTQYICVKTTYLSNGTNWLSIIWACQRSDIRRVLKYLNISWKRQSTGVATTPEINKLPKAPLRLLEKSYKAICPW